MKKLFVLFIAITLLASCSKYKFEDEIKGLETEIQMKNSQGEFTNVDTASIAANIQVILKAVTLNGSPTQWYWDFGDGSNGQGQQVDHLYAETGIYNVSVTAIDGNNSDESTIVLIVGSMTDAVFSLHSSSQPNNQGKILYVISGSKDYIPDPPVSPDGPFGYQGSNPESQWDVVQILPDTSSQRVYWEVLTHNAVYSQTYGGFSENDNFIWAEMESSRFFSEEYDHPRIGFHDGNIVEENNFGIYGYGSSGDDGNTPQIRFEVDEDQNQVHAFINIFDYAEEINSPKARFKVTKEDTWSSQQDTEWMGGSGIVKYTTTLNGAGEYRLRIEPDQYDPGQYTEMYDSDFYNADENCFIWQIVEVEKKMDVKP